MLVLAGVTRLGLLVLAGGGWCDWDCGSQLRLLGWLVKGVAGLLGWLGWVGWSW